MQCNVLSNSTKNLITPVQCHQITNFKPSLEEGERDSQPKIYIILAQRYEVSDGMVKAMSKSFVCANTGGPIQNKDSDIIS